MFSAAEMGCCPQKSFAQRCWDGTAGSGHDFWFGLTWDWLHLRTLILVFGSSTLQQPTAQEISAFLNRLYFLLGQL